ncbi:MAG: SsrA-binding protein SmpB [Alphaproteobacteria bacterium]|nr:SsrA-binding protein SmpB [Alphaproteobacteria bacterium]
MTKKSSRNSLISFGTIAKNRKARHNYIVEDTIEAGIMLTGTEVKSLRNGQCNIAESYAAPEGDSIYLFNAYIPEYKAGHHFNHETRRPRKLLLKKREISKLVGVVSREGKTLVPLGIYFNNKGIAKVEIGIATGKKSHDKRESQKERDWKRDKARLMRSKTL